MYSFRIKWIATIDYLSGGRVQNTENIEMGR
jgi:hypothetical protein